MEGLNLSFYFITDKMVELQAFFMDFAKSIAYVVLLVAVLIAGFNFALTGGGMKESVVKIVKALMFYYIVIFAYPNIVSWVTSMTFKLAEESTFSTVSGYLKNAAEGITDNSRDRVRYSDNGGYTYADVVTAAEETVFKSIINDRTFIARDGRKFSYSTVTPSAALGSILLVAGECIHYVNSYRGVNIGQALYRVVIGCICAFVVIVAGVFAVLEYLMAFIEFMFVSSVGIILFPFSLWDGTKFLAEKFITAMIGFAIKLLFCSICIFLCLYGFISIAKGFSAEPFTGAIDEILSLFFTSLLLFYLSKSAPALAQALSTGSPSLSATGAISAVAGGVAAAAGVAGMVGGPSGALSKGLAATGSIVQGAGAFKEAASTGGVGGGAKAFAQNIGSQVAHSAGDLTKSLVGMPKNEDGSVKSFGQYYGEHYDTGKKDWKSSHNKPPAQDNAPPPQSPQGPKPSHVKHNAHLHNRGY